jgi:predicted GIY-YIG superfamily endonuclease
MPTPYRGRKPVKWCVYVLRCADGSLYIGVTSRLSSRLRAHMRGKGAKRTRDVLPLTLLAVLPVGYDREEAWHLERRIYWAMTTYPDKPLQFPDIEGWIPGDTIMRRLHQLYPETFHPGVEGLNFPLAALSQPEDVGAA